MKKKNQIPRIITLTVRVKEEDLKVFQANANNHAGGNVSAWLRHAGKWYTMSKQEKIPIGS